MKLSRARRSWMSPCPGCALLVRTHVGIRDGRPGYIFAAHHRGGDELASWCDAVPPTPQPPVPTPPVLMRINGRCRWVKP